MKRLLILLIAALAVSCGGDVKLENVYNIAPPEDICALGEDIKVDYEIIKLYEQDDNALVADIEEIIPYNARTGIFGVTAVDSGFCVFKYKNGASFIKSTTCEPGGYERRQLIICGSMGTLELRPLEWTDGADGQQTEIRACYRENENDFFPWLDAGKRSKSAPQDRYDLMTRAFAEKIRQGTMNADEYEREARVHRLVLKACGIDCDYKAKIEL